MVFICIATAILLGVGVTLGWILQGGFSRRRRQVPGFWRRLWIRQLVLVPVYGLVLLPAALGLFGSLLVRTRGDETGYQGPVFDARGNWIVQDRLTLKSGTPRTPESDAERAQRRVYFDNAAGRRLRGFLVPCRAQPPTAVAILVHGLFRNAMEVEPVAAMFRDLDVEVLLLELSNHGGSDRHGFTFGYREYQDVLAAVEFLRRRPGGIGAPLVLFGVSMGGVAAALAAPEIPELRGLVLDAPMTRLVDTAYRQLHRFLKFPDFYSAMVLWHLQLWAGFEMAAVRPVDSYRRLPPDLQVLFIGAGRDFRVPPAVVREAFAAVPGPADRKVLWIAEASRHGKAWLDQHDDYLELLRGLVQRVAQPR